ncbi:MAG TPA: hypothetical protein VGE45_11530 [Chloroflexia bacterium]|jgi:hypothetical protein
MAVPTLASSPHNGNGPLKPTQGWIRVWLPDALRGIGVWQVRAGGGEMPSGPEELIAAPTGYNTVTIEGQLLDAGTAARTTISLQVYVEADRVTEIHIPGYGLDTLVRFLVSPQA